MDKKGIEQQTCPMKGLQSAQFLVGAWQRMCGFYRAEQRARV